MIIYIAAFLLADKLFITGSFSPAEGEDIMDIVMRGLGLEYLAINISAFTFAKKGEHLADEIIGV